MKKMIISTFIMLLCMTSSVMGCINSTDIQDIADATGMQYIFWDNIFNYYCDSMDDMAGQINDNNATINEVIDGTNTTIDSYLKLNNMTSEHYLNLSNQTMDSYLHMNNLTMTAYINMYNLTLNHHFNQTSASIDRMNDTVYNMTNRTEYLHNLTLMQSSVVLEGYRAISDDADRVIVDQIDSQLSRIRSDKVSYNQLNNLSDSIKMDVYAIVNRNKTSPTFYIIMFIANIVVATLLVFFMVPRIAQPGMQRGYTGTDYTGQQTPIFKSNIPFKVSKTPSIAITNENIVNQRKLLRELKYTALLLSAKDPKEFKVQLMKDIDENMLKDEEELKEHYTKTKLIYDEENKERTNNRPRVRIPKKKDAVEQ